VSGDGVENTLSRRRFLGAAGAGATALMLPAGAAAAARPHPRSVVRTDHFGRIFRLRPFARNNSRVRSALVELGKRGGLLDANDALAAGPEQLIATRR
jgi:hypothetical protein